MRALLLFALACAEKPAETDGPTSSPVEESDADADADSDSDTDADSDADADADADPCEETVSTSALPADAVWITHDGLSPDLFSLADKPLSDAWNSGYDVYDLNTEEIYGASNAYLERPGALVAVQVKWANLPATAGPADITIWPDFGTNGYSFDIENPLLTLTRCLDGSQDGQWVDYVLPAPIRLEQPGYLYAGYHRAAGADAPELMMENFYQEAEPWWSGARLPNVDPRVYYLGTHFPWFTWQVRLAVVYDPAIDPADQVYTLDAALAAGGRVAWGDYDNDGDDDLMSSGPVLFRNNGDGSFTDVSSTALTYTNGSGGGVWGDYDNDGCLDYFGQGGGSGAGELLLHNNCDGTFADVTVESGINDLQTEIDCNADGLEEHSPTEGTAWFDLDNDGLLDLYLANYECSVDYTYYDDRVWRNNGDGTFSDWTLLSGIPQTNKAGRGVNTADYDQDGDTDVYVSNYRLTQNFLLVNQGDGTLDDQAGAADVRGDCSRSACGHTIGSVWGDIDNDGDFDLITANLAHPFYYSFSDRTAVYINDGAGHFVDEGVARGLEYHETDSNPTLLDADNDGDLDLFITAVYPSRWAHYYENDGSGHFTPSTYASGLTVLNGWGAAAADPDQDLDVDLLAYSLFRNQGRPDHHALEVRLVGGAGAGGLANRSAIGAVVTVESGSLRQLRQVQGGSGTSVQDSLTQHIGLGSSTLVDRVSVLFPGGAEVTVEDVAADQLLWVHEDGRTATGWAPPAW